MVESFAAQCKAADYKLTLTGSWLGDYLEMPGFWNDVYMCWAIDSYAEAGVEATLELVSKLQGARNGNG